MRKILITLLSILFVVFLGLGIYFLYDFYHGASYTTGTVEAQSVPTSEAVSNNKNEQTSETTVETSPLQEANAKKKLSDNAVGWLRIPNADIDDVILQGTDNDYYLTHDAYDSYDVWGSYFIAAKNDFSSVENLSRKTLIFGHSNGNGTHIKFSTLKKFKDVDFAADNQFIEVWVGDTKTTWQIFGECDYPVNESDFMEVNPTDEQFFDEVNRIISLSYNQYQVEVTDADKILFLVTCVGDSNYDYRFVVAAKLVS